MSHFLHTITWGLRNPTSRVGLVFLFLTGAVFRPASATTIYVATTGLDSHDGLSWESAKLTVAGGLAVATSGDQVWVAAGVYVERITLADGVALYGGFAGNEPSDFDVSLRDFAGHASILDGNRSGQVVTAPSGATSTTRIDGFTICRGHTNSGEGGGIKCYQSSPTIANNRIVGNSATFGGGIACGQSSPVILNNAIIGNTASWGGGIECVQGAPVLANNVIAGNTGWTYGGGICCESSSSPTISSNTIVRNAALSGGAISCWSSSPTVVNNVLAFNSSGVSRNSAGSPTLGNNCVYNPGGYNYSGLLAGVGDISADPQLLVADYCDVHLTAGSPCIDAGDDTAVVPGWIDLDHGARIQGSHVDMGADEFNGTTPTFVLKVVRVSPSGNDANDGSSWASAKRTVQTGIYAASFLGGADVWVAAGTYDERISLKAWAHVYGGFAGTEHGREQRNWTAHPTILDGGAAGTVVGASAPGWGPTSRIDGFTIRNGGAVNGLLGEGIVCDSSSPVIANNIITNNHPTGATGAIWCRDTLARPAILNNIISANTMGIYCDYLCTPTIANNTIVNNTGDGISCRSCSPAISNNTIVGNLSAGILANCDTCSFVIANNIVAFNGSGIYNYTGDGPTLRNNCVYNPGRDDYIGLDEAGVGDISVDPRLVNRAAEDYRLSAASPCIDAGYNPAVPVGTLTDQTGHLRFFDDPATDDCRWAPGNCGTAPIVDIGAYEFIPPISGDADGDGDLDGEDFIRLEACTSGPMVTPADHCTGFDFDRDHDVDQVDFGIFQRCFSGVGHPADPSCGV